MKDRLLRIQAAYDQATRKYLAGADPLDAVPAELKNNPVFIEFFADSKKGLNNSNTIDNWTFLRPETGMTFLDAGCCANLASYRFDRLPCTYYGVDISPEIIRAMKAFADKEGIRVGGLEVAELSDLPFEDSFFDLASVIGVLSYFELDYIERTLFELRRVLKPGAKMVVDIANPAHPHQAVMFEFEEYLGMPNVLNPPEEFEKILRSMFRIEKTDASQVMLKYFVRAKK